MQHKMTHTEIDALRATILATLREDDALYSIVSIHNPGTVMLELDEESPIIGGAEDKFSTRAEYIARMFQLPDFEVVRYEITTDHAVAYLRPAFVMPPVFGTVTGSGEIIPAPKSVFSDDADLGAHHPGRD